MEAVKLAKAKNLPLEMLRTVKAFVGPGRRGLPTPSATAISSFCSTLRMGRGRTWGPISDEEILRNELGSGWGVNKYLRCHFDERSPLEFVHRKLGHLIQLVVADSGYEVLRSCDAEGYEFRVPGMIYVDPLSDDEDLTFAWHAVARLGVFLFSLAVNTPIDIQVDDGENNYLIHARYVRFGADGIDYLHRDEGRVHELYHVSWLTIGSVNVVAQ